jgi:hypothetical protein
LRQGIVPDAGIEQGHLRRPRARRGDLPADDLWLNREVGCARAGGMSKGVSLALLDLLAQPGRLIGGNGRYRKRNRDGAGCQNGTSRPSPHHPPSNPVKTNDAACRSPTRPRPQ